MLQDEWIPMAKDTIGASLGSVKVGVLALTTIVTTTKTAAAAAAATTTTTTTVAATHEVAQGAGLGALRGRERVVQPSMMSTRWSAA